jgi:hypothetical protein
MKAKLADAAWVADLTTALADGQDALKQAGEVAKGPAKPRIERAERAVIRVRELLAKGAKFTVEYTDDQPPPGDKDGDEPNWMGW